MTDFSIAECTNFVQGWVKVREEHLEKSDALTQKETDVQKERFELNKASDQHLALAENKKEWLRKQQLALERKRYETRALMAAATNDQEEEELSRSLKTLRAQAKELDAAIKTFEGLVGTVSTCIITSAISKPTPDQTSACQANNNPHVQQSTAQEQSGQKETTSPRTSSSRVTDQMRARTTGKDNEELPDRQPKKAASGNPSMIGRVPTAAQRKVLIKSAYKEDPARFFLGGTSSGGDAQSQIRQAPANQTPAKISLNLPEALKASIAASKTNNDREKPPFDHVDPRKGLRKRSANDDGVDGVSKEVGLAATGNAASTQSQALANTASKALSQMNSEKTSRKRRKTKRVTTNIDDLLGSDDEGRSDGSSKDKDGDYRPSQGR